MDIKGFEWGCHKDWLVQDVQQILVEVHKQPPIICNFFEDMHKSGCVMPHKEPNIPGAGGSCVKISFLKLGAGFFDGGHWEANVAS